LKKESEAVGRLWQRRRQAKLGGLPRGAPNLERRLDAVRDDLRDRRVAVDHGDRAATSHLAQVLAEVRLQLSDPHSAHGLIMVMTSHIVKTGGSGGGQPTGSALPSGA
jgi:hypothetical protein